MLLLYRRLDFTGLAERLRGLQGLPLLGFAGILVFNTAVSAAKWQVLLRADRTDVPYLKLLSSYLVGTFFNVFLPSNIGGDVYRVYDISRHSSRPVNTFASVFADRLSGFVALAAFACLFPLLGWRLFHDRRLLLLPLAASLALGVVVFLLFQQTWAKRLLARPPLSRWSKLREAGDKFLMSIAAYRRKPGVMPRVMGLSFVFQFAVIVAVYLLGQALRLDPGLHHFCLFVPLVCLLEALPVSIFGIGLRDWGYVFFLTQLGHTKAEAAALPLLYLALNLAYASVGGLVFVLKGGRRAAERREGDPP